VGALAAIDERREEDKGGGWVKQIPNSGRCEIYSFFPNPSHLAMCSYSTYPCDFTSSHARVDYPYRTSINHVYISSACVLCHLFLSLSFE
jgi:hypothetical protein